MTTPTLHTHHPVAEGRTGRKLQFDTIINRPPGEVYTFWRDFRNLGKFMHSVISVEWKESDTVSTWHVRGPLDMDLKWDAAIINDHPGELITWETIGPSAVPSAGTVRFEPQNGGHATLLRLVMDYYPPGGMVAVAVAALLFSDPERILEEDLQRLKMVLENHGAG